MSPNGSYAITIHPDNLPIERPRQKMTRFLRFPPVQDRKQAIKKDSKLSIKSHSNLRIRIEL